jgi:hypothetical protein
MSFLIDTIKLVGSLSNVREALIVALRAKGFPIKDDASLCEIVDTINSGAVDYCGFVRCWIGEETLYFPDKVEVSLDTRRVYGIYDAIIVSDVVKLVALELLPRDTKWSLIVRDWANTRKQLKLYKELDLDILGHYTDMCTYSIVHRVTENKVYPVFVQDFDIIIQDKVEWLVYNTNESELLRTGT